MSIPRRFFAFFAVTLLTSFLFSGCGGGDSDDPSSPQGDDQLLAVETFGPAGGTIETSDVTIEIPAGCFNSDQEISLFEIEGESEFGTNSASGQYKVLGFPDSFSESIRVSIRYNGELEHESYFALGSTAQDLFTGEAVVVHQLQAATDSLGYLVGNIAAEMISDSSAAVFLKDETDPPGVAFSLLTQFTSVETVHFTLKFPFLMIGSPITYLANICESAYSIVYEDIGFPESNVERVIIIKDVKNGPVNIIRERWAKGFALEIDTDLLGDGHYNEIARYLTSIVFIADEIFLDDATWLSFANALWLMEYVNTDPAFLYPPGFLKGAMEPFNGLGLVSTIQKDVPSHPAHGIGVTSIISYLAQFQGYGLTEVETVFTDFFTFDHLEALISVVDSPPDQWWPHFFEKYIGGDVYNIPISFFLGKTLDMWDVDTPQETEETFMSADSNIGFYPSLSSKMFEIKLNHEGFLENSNLFLYLDSDSGTDGCSLVVFGIQDGAAIHLGTGPGSITISDLRDKYIGGMRQILVAVVNSNTSGPLDINLNAIINNELGDITHCEFWIKVHTNLHNENAEGEETVDSADFRVQPLFTAVGFFTGMTFTGSYSHDASGDGSLYAGTVSVTLNAEASMVTDVSWSGTIDWPSGSFTDKGFSGSNMDVPFVNNLHHSLSFMKYGFQAGVNVCAGITGVNYDHTTYIGGEFVSRAWISGFSNNATSELVFYFDTDDD